jgi:hypothetical protein
MDKVVRIIEDCRKTDKPASGQLGMYEGDFPRAVEVLAAQMDGLPPFVAETESVTVYARPGSVRANAIVIGGSKSCANPGCTIHFVPRVPWQKYCPRCRSRKVTSA